MNITRKRTYLALHLMLFLLSLTGICSKLAARETFLSVKFCLLYGMMLVILGVYAIAWQQVIKRLPLSVAYANKAVSVVWGMAWGVLVFHEAVTARKLAGAVIVIAGVILYAHGGRSDG